MGVTHGDRESMTDSDPHGLFFDALDDGSPDGPFLGEPDDGRVPRVRRVSRSERRAEAGTHARRRRNRRALLIMALLLVGVVAAATWLVVLPIYRYLNPADYSGQGSGSVIVEVHANDGAQQIAEALKKQGVVASVRAFTDAAKDDKRSQSIQPGAYELRKHMSAKNALALLLDPQSRVNSDVLVTEGATSLDVVARLTAKPCDKQVKAKLCGPGMSPAAVQQALRDVKALGLPSDYLAAGKTPRSVEGFLYPATYYFPARTTPAQALGQMITNFTDRARSTNFTAAAKANGITPYQQLIIASIAQSEARYPDDMPKVVRVILNRLRANRKLQVDATSVYGARLQHLSGVDHNKVPGPYNTYTHVGLPPTPISNPGADAMDAAAHPAAGNWLFYVNGDAAGHLFFTNSEAAFVKAAAACRKNHWGCG